MLRLLSIFLFLISLMACDIGAKLDVASKDIAEVVQIIKIELNVEPDIFWNVISDFDGDFIQVIVEFDPKDVKGIDIDRLKLVSRKAVMKTFKPTPDEIIVRLAK